MWWIVASWRSRLRAEHICAENMCPTDKGVCLCWIKQNPFRGSRNPEASRPPSVEHHALLWVFSWTFYWSTRFPFSTQHESISWLSKKAFASFKRSTCALRFPAINSMTDGENLKTNISIYLEFCSPHWCLRVSNSLSVTCLPHKKAPVSIIDVMILISFLSNYLNLLLVSK